MSLVKCREKSAGLPQNYNWEGNRMNRPFHFVFRIRMSIVMIALFVCSASTLAQENASSSVPQKKYEDTLINALRFRSVLKESMMTHGGSAPLRRLHERYHEDVAVPALHNAAQLAIAGGSNELLVEIYRFVVECRDSADEEVGLIAASVFQKKIDSSIAIIETFNTADIMTVVQCIEFGAANLGVEGRAITELPEALSRLRKAVLKK